ncbi:hypothetical protein TWF506_006892 [Arthrobotrys conoides]|uniref:Chromatin assembly factor 1 subunit A n=1 Tax=Arthrobotrys conoides TaxID=74498 RepID=A0AAN8NCT9_9PEZI
MTSESGQGDKMASIRYAVEQSSPLSSCPPSPSPPPPRKRSVSPAPITSLPDTETTKKLSNLELDGKNDPPAKKRTKLTPAEKAEKEKEKEERKREKEEKEKEKEKEKAKIKAEKDEQKRLKDEEKAKKDLEKAAEKARRDEEKAKRDEEKAKRDGERAKKEEEKLKKERSQLRMDSFFARKAPTAPVATSISAAPPPTAVPTKANDTPTFQLVTGATAADVQMLDGSLNHDGKNDYTKTFQPFFVRPGVKLAPLRAAGGADAADDSSSQVMDRVLFKSINVSSDEMEIDSPGNRIIVDSTIPEHPSPSDFKALFSFRPSKWKKGSIPKFSTKQILAGLNSSPIPDLFGTRKVDNTNYVRELQRLTRKTLKYAEDVRPAYRGTYTRVPTTSGLRKGRNPFQKSLPGVEYDYDSEAEWVHEPDDDGEDIMSEEDEDPMDTGSADEMEDFLDDEEETVKKKANVAGPLIPAASGLMWEGECPHSDELMHYKIGVLIEGGTTPIDPFSMQYWASEKRKLVAQPRAAPVAPEKGKSKAPANTWWNAAPQRLDSATSSTLGPALQSVVSVSQNPGGQVPLRYGQNLPPLRNGYVRGPQPSRSSEEFGRSPSATHFSDGTPYIHAIMDPTARATLFKLQADTGPAPLVSLADPEYARSMGIPPSEHYIFFSVYHNLDYCDMTEYSTLEKAQRFIVGSDANRIFMLEALKKNFNYITKNALKTFLSNYCDRLGTYKKIWACVFRKNEHSYWELDPEVCSNIPPGQPIAPATDQAGPSQQR